MTVRAHRPDFQPERRAAAAKLYAELGTVRKVAEAMGVSSTQAYRLLVDAGVMPLRKQ